MVSYADGWARVPPRGIVAAALAQAIQEPATWPAALAQAQQQMNGWLQAASVPG